MTSLRSGGGRVADKIVDKSYMRRPKRVTNNCNNILLNFRRFCDELHDVLLSPFPKFFQSVQNFRVSSYMVMSIVNFALIHFLVSITE